MDYHVCREDALRARTDILQCAATIVIPYYYILSFITYYHHSTVRRGVVYIKTVKPNVA